ncbi:chemotaxis protein CheW [Bosea sp. (in: a-proteobacteria)]|uniref:chemotaxis protein CheW n=1 Tax=Bosea sp. (in: a-proteobacteria) TaxID=1871050 RepID=UPI0027345F65|nr:chemotaxis protein CheW [Bosea sp. (in: a-proteobacteria)]MDP3408981.1 chemotaxis protein CheW [Bosea sp. (in: a-proteobacteria)]
MPTLREGYEIDPALAGLIRHMRAIDDYRQVFDRLQASWDTLTLLGQLSGNATEMSGTRSAFEALTASLLGHLAKETRDKAMADLRIKAQNAIDVLVRNLFERTADIGFLAADTDIREMLEAPVSSEARAAIEARFRDYVAKYSVYSDIVLVDREGAIRARLAPHAAQEARHPVIDEALGSTGAYVEHYGVLDFVSDAQSLVYAWRVEDTAKRPLGVLVLVFRLADEMAGIFRKLLPEQDWTVLGCVSPGGDVIAGSCPIQLPAGLKLSSAALQGAEPVIRLGGRQYLAMACRTSGYQGYMGPGWMGLGLIPLDAAFDQNDGELAQSIGEDLLAAVTSQAGLFSDELRHVSRQAAAIQGDLNRSVWNGSIRQAGSTAANAAFSKILLWEISSAGRKTQSVCDASIGDLHRTVVAAIMEKCRSRAAFAIDVMDRNLYERANDCRWWALNASLARVLAAPSPEGRRLCGEILATINALYTVYSNLILFDAQGVVVAVSQPAQAHLVGERLDAEWVGRTLALRSGQHYAVSAFEPTPLYDDASTLIYTAAVQAPSGGRALGGIAIVFDSTPQFAAILADSLPTDEEGAAMPGAFAVIVGSDGRVMASSDPRFAIGSDNPLPVEPASLERDGDLACIRSFEGKHMAVGAALSKGYREYKTSDGHRADVVALCAVPLGDVATASAARPAQGSRAAGALAAHKPADGVEAFEVASFHIGRHWLGVRARDVVEAVDIVGLKPSARKAGDGLLAGYKLHEGQPVPVLRLARLLGIPDASSDEQQIVVVRAAGRTLGLIVDALGLIPEIAASELQPLRDLTSKTDVPALGVVATRNARGEPAGMLMVLDVDRLGARLQGEGGPALVQAAE